MAVLVGPANQHDSVPFEELIDAVPGVRHGRGRPRHRFRKLHADKAYDFRRCRMACKVRGILSRIARRGVETAEKLGKHRWVVERTFAWFRHFKRLTVRAKIDDFHFHDLRHEGVSRLFMTAMTDVEIMKMTGHSSAATLARYAHNRASNVAAKINARWSPDKLNEPKKPEPKNTSRVKISVSA